MREDKEQSGSPRSQCEYHLTDITLTKANSFYLKAEDNQITLH